MICKKVLNKESVELVNVRYIYEESFPLDERRDYTQLVELLSRNDTFILQAICIDDEVVGMLSSWKLNGWLFIEHFAIAPACRGRGIGREVLLAFIERSKTPIVLEVEPPTDDYSRRRIDFYRSVGFVLHDTYRYIQPPYGEGREAVELRLMTYGAPTNCNLDLLACMLHSSVYGVK